MISASELRRFQWRTAPGLRSGRVSARTSVFLSHSHKDSELVESVKKLLGTIGVSVYVDWLDPGMPSTTTSATAERVREKILENEKFLLLATNNSLDSRWVPWELGLADGLKGVGNMAVLEVKPDYGNYRGSEYIELYPKIEGVAGNYRWVPGAYESRGRTRQPLSNWMR